MVICHSSNKNVIRQQFKFSDRVHQIRIYNCVAYDDASFNHHHGLSSNIEPIKDEFLGLEIEIPK